MRHGIKERSSKKLSIAVGHVPEQCARHAAHTLQKTTGDKLQRVKLAQSAHETLSVFVN
jgi:hypothetical protein